MHGFVVQVFVDSVGLSHVLKTLERSSHFHHSLKLLTLLDYADLFAPLSIARSTRQPSARTQRYIVRTMQPLAIVEEGYRTRSNLTISNLHCPSCVQAITDILSSYKACTDDACQPEHADEGRSQQTASAAPISDIDVSILNHSVQFSHPLWLHLEHVSEELAAGGFEVLHPRMASTSTDAITKLLPTKRRKERRAKSRKHRTVCKACQAESEKLPRSIEAVTEAEANSAATISDEVDSSGATGTYTCILSIEGMTCASCSGTVSDAIKAVIDQNNRLSSFFTVDLLGGSASVEIDDASLAEQIVNEVEDRGFGCEIVSLKPAKTQEAGKINQGPDAEPRSVRIRIDGLYCYRCLDKVQETLEGLRPMILSFSPITSVDAPFSTIRYNARPPDFTLRTIKDAIANLGFQLSVVRETPLSERAKAAARAERRRILRYLLVDLIFVIPTFIIAIVGMSLLPQDDAFRRRLSRRVVGNSMLGDWVLLALAVSVQCYVGSFFYKRSWQSLFGVWRSRKNLGRDWTSIVLKWGSMDTLVALGTTISFAASMVWLSLASAGYEGTQSTSFDVSIFLFFFILGGRYLESLAKSKTAESIHLAEQQKSSQFWLYTDKPKEQASQHLHMDATLLEIGDLVVVPDGSAAPLDGTLTEYGSGQAAFDESLLTGESSPVSKEPGHEIYAGSTNVSSSSCVIRVTRTSGNCAIDDIMSAVKEAASKKASVELAAQKITAIFVPCIIYLGLAVFIIWLSLGLSGHLPQSFLSSASSSSAWVLFASEFAVAVIISACPCGIGLAAPTAQLIGVGLAAKRGILATGGGEAFETMRQIKACVFDKTGTLTEGRFVVADVKYFGSASSEETLCLLQQMLRAAENKSSHPLAQGITRWAQEQIDAHGQTASNLQVSGVQEVHGKGVVANLLVDNTAVVLTIGNASLVDVEVDDETQAQTNIWQKSSKTVIYVGCSIADATQTDSAVARTLGLSTKPALLASMALYDPPRSDALSTIERLKSLKIDVYIVSGDAQRTAESIGNVLKVNKDNIVGGALPVEKANFVERLQKSVDSKRTLVAFVGEGVNDSPAIASADVGIAVGNATNVAKNASDFSLLSGSLSTIITLHSLSRATLRRIHLNFAWAIVYNACLLPLAAGCFYKLGHTRLPPVWASLAMALSSISVVLSSLALKYTFKAPKL